MKGNVASFAVALMVSESAFISSKIGVFSQRNILPYTIHTLYLIAVYFKFTQVCVSNLKIEILLVFILVTFTTANIMTLYVHKKRYTEILF